MNFSSVLQSVLGSGESGLGKDLRGWHEREEGFGESAGAVLPIQGEGPTYRASKLTSGFL